MKIDVKEATVVSNVPQENVTAMSISVDGMEHIMSLLTNLYKDPELAVIREYYTNALDAHVAAGVNEPVRVTLPTWDSPNYIVQDFGIGMSKDDITNIYAQYGASTKRNTNDQVGAFGLGCKSALTITQQFTLVSVKDGYKTTVLIAKSEKGINTVNVISHVKTDDRNGTLVNIPVSSKIYDFDSKARRFFAFSKPGTVLVDGREVEYALSTATKIVDPHTGRELFLKPRATGESYVIMGSVPYALSHEEINLSLKRIEMDASRSFVSMPKFFPVDIGSVDLTPSREGLRFTDKTNALIDEYFTFLLKDMKKIAQDEMDAATDIDEFFTIYKSWKDVLPMPCAWNGEVVPAEIHIKGGYRSIDRDIYGNSSHKEASYFRIDSPTKFTVAQGIGPEDYKKVNSYLTPYMHHEGITSTVFLIVEDKEFFDNKYIKSSKRFTYVDHTDIIEKGKAQRKKDRAANKPTGPAKPKTKISYPVLYIDDQEVRWVEYDKIPSGTPHIDQSAVRGGLETLIKDIYRYTNDQDVSETICEYFEALTTEKQIILLNRSRTLKALEQRIKTSPDLKPAIIKANDTIKALITPEVIQFHSIANSGWKNFLTSTGVAKQIDDLKDPEIVKIIKPRADILKSYQKYEIGREALRYLSFHGSPMLPSIPYMNGDTLTGALDKKYPLINHIQTWNLKKEGVDHIVKYLNHIHEDQLQSILDSI